MSTQDLEEIPETSVHTRETPEWMKSNRQGMMILIGLGVVVVIGVAVWLYMQYKNDQNTEATMALARIRPVYIEGRYSMALTGDSIPPVGDIDVMGLTEISAEYGGTEAGKDAALLAGHSLVSLGRYAEAVAEYEQAEKSDAVLVQVGALNGLGVCKEVDKDLAGAAAYYEKAADKGLKTGLEARSLLYAGLAYEKAGDTKKAGELFTRIVRKYGASESSSAAKTGLARLGMAID
ncbi:MAG: tetratricopeptide repeat protein [bacterium]|nr:tetratricopeptide repeat protein [bacterium]